MGSKKPTYGVCKICGNAGKLSFEHVPPKKAFNNNEFYYEAALEKLAIISNVESYWQEAINTKVTRKRQGGIGFKSICEKCNNLTGAWYANDYISWVYQGMSILLKTKGIPSLYYPQFFYPLRVIKQVITMFFSVNIDDFRLQEPELVDFVLNKEKRFLNEKYKIYCYYNIEGSQRYLGNNFIGELGSKKLIHLSEITFPPFGFVITFNSKISDRRLTDISHFATFRYEDWTDFYVKFNTLPTYLPYSPLDYRSKEDIQLAIDNSNNSRAEQS